MNKIPFFSKRDLLTLAGVVASVVVPKFIFPDEYIEVIEPVDEPDEEPTRTVVEGEVVEEDK